MPVLGQNIETQSASVVHGVVVIGGDACGEINGDGETPIPQDAACPHGPRAAPWEHIKPRPSVGGEESATPTQLAAAFSCVKQTLFHSPPYTQQKVAFVVVSGQNVETQSASVVHGIIVTGDEGGAGGAGGAGGITGGEGGPAGQHW